MQNLVEGSSTINRVRQENMTKRTKDRVDALDVREAVLRDALFQAVAGVVSHLSREKFCDYVTDGASERQFVDTDQFNDIHVHAGPEQFKKTLACPLESGAVTLVFNDSCVFLIQDLESVVRDGVLEGVDVILQL